MIEDNEESSEYLKHETPVDPFCFRKRTKEPSYTIDYASKEPNEFLIIYSRFLDENLDEVGKRVMEYYFDSDGRQTATIEEISEFTELTTHQVREIVMRALEALRTDPTILAYYQKKYGNSLTKGGKGNK